ncbi:hypothetical protein H5410_042167 [Solanum commersonii]|uniref:Endonuclease/exonuclease/phosphatase domain-containing protein n=1 Tax=Solanum commersonii TaxID=4109 RepID=A0A9J5XUY8_SOLCO|nr:hypothetical protein H5410_042167 [Solanum commersonii]
MTDNIQQLTINFRLRGTQDIFVVTVVYARCNALERLELWENLETMAGQNYPWLIGGDFNTTVDETEKLGGLPVTQSETHNFIQCVNSCALTELRYMGSTYTWWNGRIKEDCIFKRLDRVFDFKKMVEKSWKIQGDFIYTSQNISDKAVNVFREQFRETQEVTAYSMLQFIPKIITREHNLEMERVPTKDEIKHVVFRLNGDSASRHDGYSGFSFRVVGISWEMMSGIW